MSHTVSFCSSYLGDGLDVSSRRLVNDALSAIQNLLYRIASVSLHDFSCDLYAVCWDLIFAHVEVFDISAFYGSFDHLIDLCNSFGYSDYVAQLLDLFQRLRFLLPVPDFVL